MASAKLFWCWGFDGQDFENRWAVVFAVTLTGFSDALLFAVAEAKRINRIGGVGGEGNRVKGAAVGAFGLRGNVAGEHAPLGIAFGADEWRPVWLLLLAVWLLGLGHILMMWAVHWFWKRKEAGAGCRAFLDRMGKMGPFWAIWLKSTHEDARYRARIESGMS